MKLRSIVSSLIAASLVLASTHPVEAQKKRPVGVASLAEMSCQSIKGGSYRATNEDIPVGLEIFRAVSVTGDINNREVRQYVCRLAQPKEKPKYKTLTLAFGLSDKDHRNKNSPVVRLSLYKDGKAYEYKDIAGGEKLLWQVDVTGVRSLAVETECVKSGFLPNDWRVGQCPDIYFFEDTLK